MLRVPVRVYYRHVWIPPTGDPDPFYVQRGEGRFATDWTLYTGTGEVVVWAEYCRNHAADVEAADITGGAGLDEPALRALANFEVPVAARSLYEVTFAFERLADLTSPWGQELLERAGFDLEDLLSDDYGQCPELARRGVDLGWEAIKVPSAAWRFPDETCIAVFEQGRSRLRDVRRSVVAARPTVAVSVATTYRDGERPDWLGSGVTNGS